MVLPPALPASFLRADLERAGFVGWRRWAELSDSNFFGVPSGPAVYVVYQPTGDNSMLAANPGGRFKGRDPSASLEALRTKWVPGAKTVYIGKADVTNRRLERNTRVRASLRL